jgi:predicted metal-dependent hydrolase
MLEQLTLFRLPPATPEERPRHVVLQGRAVPYRLQQDARRRRLSITVDERGLRAGAPRAASRSEIESFIHTHSTWVLNKLDDIARASVPRHLSLRDGLRLPVLGSEIALRVLPGPNRHRWIADTLVLEARPGADLAPIARRALQKRALAHLTDRLHHFAPQLGVSVPAVGLSAARTRWGSCSSRSGIRLNWRLIHLPPHLGDYVAIHELAHLREMNHSPRFWALVASLYPDWKAARAELKSAAPRIPLI